MQSDDDQLRPDNCVDPMEEAQELISDYLVDVKGGASSDCHELVLSLETLLSRAAAAEADNKVATNRMISRAYDEGHQRALEEADLDIDIKVIELSVFQEQIIKEISIIKKRVKDLEKRRLPVVNEGPKRFKSKDRKSLNRSDTVYSVVCAARKLLEKVELIINDDQFNWLFVMAKIHDREYTGPQFAGEIELLKMALSELDGHSELNNTGDEENGTDIGSNVKD